MTIAMLATIVVCLVVIPAAAAGVEIWQNPSYVKSYLVFPPPAYQLADQNLHELDALTPDDIAVFQWIVQNTPSNATFLVNQGDAGEYLTVITGRASMYPYSVYTDIASAYQTLVSAVEFNSSDPQTLSLLLNNHIDYIFVGSTQAGTNAVPADTPGLQFGLFNASALESSPFLTLAVNMGNVWVFKITTT